MKDTNENESYLLKQVFSGKDLYPSYSKYPFGEDFNRNADEVTKVNIMEISKIKVLSRMMK